MFFVRSLFGATHFLIIICSSLNYFTEGKTMKTQRVGMMRKVDNLGRIVIPKEYRDFYHLNHNDEVFIIDTPEGLLITNPKYKTVKIEEKGQEL